MDTSNVVYKWLRSWGISSAFYVHWVLYIFLLINAINETKYMNGNVSYLMLHISICFISVIVICTLVKCGEDCCQRYLNACIFTIVLRCVVWGLKPYGFDDSREIMIVCGVAMFAFFAIRKYNIYSKNKYFNY